jgi:non-ribosomal peptide synthetase component F
VGFFVNTLVLRSQHQPQWHFEQLLQQVKQDATAAFDHQDVPFEYLVEKLNPERDSAFNPLFQVMFTLQTAQGNTSIVSPEQWIAHFDLQLIAVQQADGLFLTWEFNRDLFDRATIELLAESFRHLAGQIVSGQAASEVSQLSILPPKTRDGISKAEQGPQSDWPFTDVMAAFDHQVATRGEATALLMAQTTMTY